MPTALVTGANRGLGLETVRQLGRKGWRVVMTSRDEAAGQEAAQRLREEDLDVAFELLDVTDPGSLVTAAEALAGRGEELDALINNAGIALDSFDVEVARRTLAVNVEGALSVTDAMAPHIRTGGTVVMVSSGMGDLSSFASVVRNRLRSPGLDRDGLDKLMGDFINAVATGRHRLAGWPGNAYAVSKACLNAATRVLAAELAPRKIRVNAVCPGWVRTRMGGLGAPRDVGEGARSIVLAIDVPTTGGFFRDGRPISW